jgi:hypothetical protein
MVGRLVRDESGLSALLDEEGCEGIGVEASDPIIGFNHPHPRWDLLIDTRGTSASAAGASRL